MFMGDHPPAGHFAEASRQPKVEFSFLSGLLCSRAMHERCDKRDVMTRSYTHVLERKDNGIVRP